MKRNRLFDILIYPGIVLLSGLLFIPFLGGVHLFDWDEINFAESAREMIMSGDYLTVQIDFLPFWEKPPLFIWMQVLSMKLFGINEFAARFPNAICGIITLVILYTLGRRMYDPVFGLLWTMTYACSLLPFLYFKSGIIDPWFNLFIFLGIFQVFQYFERDTLRLLPLSLSAVFIGVAILTKGPVALLVFALVILIYIVIKKFRVDIRFNHILLFSIILVIIGGLWFFLQILQGNFYVIKDFIAYQIYLFKARGAGHGGFFMYHFVVLFFGVFPASVLAIPALIRRGRGTKSQTDFYLLMKILFWVVIILFSVVKTKIVHYSSLCYFPVAFLAASILYQMRDGRYKPHGYVSYVSVSVGLLFAISIMALFRFEYFRNAVLTRIRIEDPFALAALGSDAGWNGWEGIPGVALLAGITLFIATSRHKQVLLRWYLHFISFCLFTYLSVLFITPRAESYSQRAAIDFLKSVSTEDAYIETLGFKSYAHFFYGKRKPGLREESRSKSWLMTGNVDKKVYVILKADKKEKLLKQYPLLRILYEKNGYVFCIRE